MSFLNSSEIKTYDYEPNNTDYIVLEIVKNNTVVDSITPTLNHLTEAKTQSSSVNSENEKDKLEYQLEDIIKKDLYTQYLTFIEKHPEMLNMPLSFKNVFSTPLQQAILYKSYRILHIMLNDKAIELNFNQNKSSFDVIELLEHLDYNNTENGQEILNKVRNLISNKGTKK
jgi:hypothetical protein